MNNPDAIRLDLPANHKYLNVLGGCIAQMLARAEGIAEPKEVIYNTQLAVHEICTNIVEHAYKNNSTGRIKITLTLLQNPHQFVVDLVDAGSSFDLDAVSIPNLNEGQVHGYGLYLARQLLDVVTYQPQPDHNRWHLVKKL